VRHSEASGLGDIIILMAKRDYPRRSVNQREKNYTFVNNDEVLVTTWTNAHSCGNCTRHTYEPMVADCKMTRDE
jgi:hypothetical protein